LRETLDRYFYENKYLNVTSEDFNLFE